MKSTEHFLPFLHGANINYDCKTLKVEYILKIKIANKNYSVFMNLKSSLVATIQKTLQAKTLLDLHFLISIYKA